MNFSIGEQLRRTYWRNWLAEYVEYENDWCERQEAILIFVEEDLVPFVKSFGYIFHSSEKELAQIIARELFHSLCNSTRRIKWHSKVLNVDYVKEDEDYFYHLLDTRVWEGFWKSVSLWCDVEEDVIRTRSIIEHACWTCINVENSPASQVVNDMFDTDDDDSITSKKEKNKKDNERDPYLAEQNHGEY
jgi:hypothetical protein